MNGATRGLAALTAGIAIVGLMASTASAATLTNETATAAGSLSAEIDTVRVVKRPRYSRLRFSITGTAVGLPYTRPDGTRYGDKVWGAPQPVAPRVAGSYSITCTSAPRVVDWQGGKFTDYDSETVSGSLGSRITTRRLPLAKPARCTVKVSARTHTDDVPGLTNIDITESTVTVKVTSLR